MAKRVRGSSTRPGQRARLQRRGPTTRPASQPPAPSTSRPGSLTEAEEARAAELEAQIVASERAAETAIRTRERAARRPVEVETRTRSGSIAERAAHEYAYVIRDVRKIVAIGGFLLTLLLVLWFVLQANAVTGL